MDKNNIHIDIFSTSEHPSDEMLMQYAHGHLTDDEKRIVEHHLNDCEMCGDIVEGYQKLDSEKHQKTITELEQQIDEKVRAVTRNKRSNVVWYYAAAAVIILALTATIYNYYFKTVVPSDVAVLTESSVKQGEVENINTDTAMHQQAPTVIDNASPIEESEDVAERKMEKFDPVSQTGIHAMTEPTTAEEQYKAENELPAPSIDYESQDPADNVKLESVAKKSKQVLAKSYQADKVDLKNNNMEKVGGGATMTNAKEESRMAQDVAPTAKAEKIADDMNDEYILTQEIEVLKSQKKYKEALKELKRYLKHHPQNCYALNEAANMSQHLGKENASIKYYSKVIDLKCPLLADKARISLALIYINNNQQDIAKKLLHEAMNSDNKEIKEKARAEFNKLEKE
ncbi:MAG: hypothetical protein IT238_01320 [Bacteroidia bacterium]|nr:hypothetical protein [Bacteroidia bacterium]MCZ2247616.1 hypothetical protein [Bacteroidia bacterium]